MRAGGNEIPDGYDKVVNWVGNAWTATRDAVSQFPEVATTFVTNTAQRMVEDPLGFVQTVGQGIMNTQVVIANTMTFGLIPSMNDAAERIIDQNGFIALCRSPP